MSNRISIFLVCVMGGSAERQTTVTQRGRHDKTSRTNQTKLDQDNDTACFFFFFPFERLVYERRINKTNTARSKVESEEAGKVRRMNHMRMKLQLLTEHSDTVSNTGHEGLKSTLCCACRRSDTCLKKRAVMRGSEGSWKQAVKFVLAWTLVFSVKRLKALLPPFFSDLL